MNSDSYQTAVETRKQERLEMHAALLALAQDAVRLEVALAYALERFDRKRGFEALGCSSIGEYAEAHLELSRRQARRLVDLGRRLPGLPVLRGALECGELGTSKARELLRVVVPETEPEWVEFAARARACPQINAAILPGSAPLARRMSEGIVRLFRGHATKPEGMLPAQTSPVYVWTGPECARSSTRSWHQRTGICRHALKIPCREVPLGSGWSSTSLRRTPR